MTRRGLHHIGLRPPRAGKSILATSYCAWHATFPGSGRGGRHILAVLKLGVLPRIRPMRLKLVKEPFDNPDYIFELKQDGFRATAYIDEGECRLVSRNKKAMAQSVWTFWTGTNPRSNSTSRLVPSISSSGETS